MEVYVVTNTRFNMMLPFEIVSQNEELQSNVLLFFNSIILYTPSDSPITTIHHPKRRTEQS